MEYALDEIDRNIIKVVQKQPTITQTDIAKKVERSQPTVGMRVDRLEDMGVLQFQAGVNLKRADLFIAQVEIETNHTEKILDLVKNCPIMVNAFRLSGPKNINIILVSRKIAHLDKVVNHHFRNNPLVKSATMNLITDFLEDLVMPMDLDFEECNCDLKEECIKCWNQQ
jgi:DNA-binding Lrp family transcriptional regulator